MLCHPEVARFVPSHEMGLSAGHALRGNKPAVRKPGKSLTREGPDSSAIVLKDRLRRIIRQSTRLAEDGHVSVIPPVQTIGGANPNAAISRCQHGPDIIAGQALFHGNGGDGELSEAVQSSIGGGPDIALTVFKKTEDEVARQAVRSRKDVGPALMYVDEPPVQCSDPKTAITVPEQPVCTKPLPKAGNRIRLGPAMEEPLDSAGHRDQQFPLVTLIQIPELDWGHRIMRGRTGSPSPESGLCAGPDTARPVLK